MTIPSTGPLPPYRPEPLVVRRRRRLPAWVLLSAALSLVTLLLAAVALFRDDRPAAAVYAILTVLLSIDSSVTMLVYVLTDRPLPTIEVSDPIPLMPEDGPPGPSAVSPPVRPMRASRSAWPEGWGGGARR